MHVTKTGRMHSTTEAPVVDEMTVLHSLLLWELAAQESGPGMHFSTQLALGGAG